MKIHLDSELTSLQDPLLFGGDGLGWVRRQLPDCAVTFGESIGDAEVLVSGRVLPEAEDSDHLKWWIIPFAGVPQAVLEWARRHPESSVTSLHFNAAATAEMAVTLLLAAARQIVPAHQQLREGRWAGRQAEDVPQFLLAGKTAAIFGYGEIGQRVGRTLEALGMSVIGIRRHPQGANEVSVGARLGVLSKSHALVVTAPGGEATQGLIGAEELRALRPPRLVVNVGRGSVIQEEALYEALRDGSVAGAGIDVWYRYPRDDGPQFPSQFPIHEFPNVVLSPHRAGGGDDIERLRIEDVVATLRRIVDGKPVRTVDLEAGY